jgi:uncharacterized protein (DUF488 family)
LSDSDVAYNLSVDARDLDPSVDYIFTIGHSNQPFESLLENLRAYGIEALVDVRSQPSSRFSPQFNRKRLDGSLPSTGIEYVFMGDALGGRPSDERLYGEDGHVRYDALSKTPAFSRGIDDLIARSRCSRTAIMCAEEDPSACHRQLLIARVLTARGVDPEAIIHIRKTGEYTSDAALSPQPRLISDSWRSPAPLLAKRRRAS